MNLEDLIKENPSAWILLSIVIHRTNKWGDKVYVSDYRSFGLTERQYRTAKKYLTDKRRICDGQATERKSFLTIINKDVKLLISLPATDKRRTSDGQATGKKSKFIEPTPLEVEEYARSINYEIDGAYFIMWYRERDWKFKDGRPVKNWRLCLQTWKQHSKKDKPVVTETYCV